MRESRLCLEVGAGAPGRPQLGLGREPAATPRRAGMRPGRRRGRSRHSPSGILLGRRVVVVGRRAGPVAGRWHSSCDRVDKVTIVPPSPFGAGLVVPLRPQDPGNAWVVAPIGGAVLGCLRRCRAAGARLEHGGVSAAAPGVVDLTTAIPGRLPGGARHEGESAGDGALREAAEEAGGAARVAVRPQSAERAGSRHTGSYTTLGGRRRAPVRADDQATQRAASSRGSRRPRSPTKRTLHPAFATSWAALRAQTRTCGLPSWWMPRTSSSSVPDGWWQQIAPAAARTPSRPDRPASAEDGVPGGGARPAKSTPLRFPEWVSGRRRPGACGGRRRGG